MMLRCIHDACNIRDTSFIIYLRSYVAVITTAATAAPPPKQSSVTARTTTKGVVNTSSTRRTKHVVITRVNNNLQIERTSLNKITLIYLTR